MQGGRFLCCVRRPAGISNTSSQALALYLFRALRTTRFPMGHSSLGWLSGVWAPDRPRTSDLPIVAPRTRGIGSTTNQPRASWHARPAQSSTSNTPSPHARLFHLRVDSAASPWMARPGRACVGRYLPLPAMCASLCVHPTNNLMLPAVDEQVAAAETTPLPKSKFLMRAIGHHHHTGTWPSLLPPVGYQQPVIQADH